MRKWFQKELDDELKYFFRILIIAILRVCKTKIKKKKNHRFRANGFFFLYVSRFFYGEIYRLPTCGFFGDMHSPPSHGENRMRKLSFAHANNIVTRLGRAHLARNWLVAINISYIFFLLLLFFSAPNRFRHFKICV